ncbi:MAG: electron transfer flavoprotein subunit alpha/FixB family protein [Chloroflexi bacterium]|nr:electron transfer flavoprotein subunit alpha/FixB family protein [Chloroflexota bacterium]
MPKDVLVHAELAGGRLAGTALEILGLGRKAADELGGRVVAAVLGPGARDSADEAIRAGADVVLAGDDDRYARFPIEAPLAALRQVCGEIQPDLVLLGHTPVGRDVAPMLAVELGVGLASDCTDLLLEGGQIQGVHPMYGGKIVAVLAPEGSPKLVTVRQKAVDPAAPDPSRQGEVVACQAPLDSTPLRVELLSEQPDDSSGEMKIEDAEVLVSGGRGMGGPENFEQLQQLAKILGGTISGSLPTIENGWLPVSRQVGLSGKVVKPRLYIAVAISGAMQHQAGMSGAKTIVAINQDENAPIYKLAHFGVVGRWQDILPAFTRKVAELVAE